MHDSYDILAVLLAAEDHPHLQEEEAYQEAKRKMDASPDLQAAFAEARDFFDRHPSLIGIGGMPDDVRKRIGAAIEKHRPLSDPRLHTGLSPWTIRTQFAWAALLVLLLAAMAVLSSRLSEYQVRQRQMLTYQTQPPADAFRSFAGGLVNTSLPLQEMNSDPALLVNWLASRSEAPLTLPPAFANQEGIGCAVLDGPNGKVALVCFKVDDRIVHLFITPAASLQLEAPRPPQSMVIQRRQALQWNNRQQAYLLMAHTPDQALPEIFL